MNKKKIGVMIFIIVVLIGIGGKLFMDKRAKDLAELHEIQTDLANYLYNNYRIYKKDRKKAEEIKKEYAKGEGSLTEEVYLEKMKSIREYSDISKIEFTGFSVGPMNSLEVRVIINDVYTLNASSNTVSAEARKLLFDFNTGKGQNNYFLEETKESRAVKLPEKNIIYDNKGVR